MRAGFCPPPSNPRNVRISFPICKAFRELSVWSPVVFLPIQGFVHTWGEQAGVSLDGCSWRESPHSLICLSFNKHLSAIEYVLVIGKDGAEAVVPTLVHVSSDQVSTASGLPSP